MQRDIPDELMQRIQSRLPVKEAARTSVLSKSWLHAWSTNPSLMFHVVGRGKVMEYGDRTLKRYLSDNIPIEKFFLKLNIEKQESACVAEKWIGPMATKNNSLKVFSLSVTLDKGVADFTLPDELLSGEKLTRIRVEGAWGENISVRMTTSRHPVIKCVSLKQLHLRDVHISEEALNHILLSCTLLVKIELINILCCTGFKAIKVTNLARLYELRITLNGWRSTALEISHVPSLDVFSYQLYNSCAPLPLTANVHNVTQLELGGVVRDTACLDMIKSVFPFLESLTLDLTTCWKLGSFHFACESIKRLSLESIKRLSDVTIHAPKLRFFSFTGGHIMPNLLFPVSSSSLWRIKLSLVLRLPIDASFFLKMREALTLSPNCNIHIKTCKDFEMDVDMDDLRRRLVLPPATNVQQLHFKTFDDECLWERSPFFDAFFDICHPMHVVANPDEHFGHKNHFCRLMLMEVLEKKNTAAVIWPRHLKHVLVRRLPHEKWKTLKTYHTSFLHGSLYRVNFKLNWR